MALWFKRFLLVVLSIGGGVVSLLLVWAVLNAVYNAGITLERYGIAYALWTAIPISVFCAIWLDYFLDTGLLGPSEQIKS